MTKSLTGRTSATLFEVMKTINGNALGVLFIVDDNNKLCGVITDGDARRAILAGKELESPVEDMLGTDFIFAYADEPYSEWIKKTSYKIKIIPIVNRAMEVVDYFKFKHEVHFPVAAPYLNGNEFKYLTDAFMSTWISSRGTYINRFEEEFARYCECQHGVSTSNGTVALHLALLALGVGEGDEVIIPDLTFAATINAVLHANAMPVIVDVEAESWCIDPAGIKAAITPRTKAIIPVHLYGQPCDMDAIMAIATEHNLYVIEDCAEAHGATYKGQKVGSFGDVGCFSFFGNKVITTGEGGMCVTRSAEVDDKMRLLRDHGMSKERRYWHNVVGYNYRMTNLQAAIGCGQLERIDEILANRKSYEMAFRKLFAGRDELIFQRDDLPGRKKITWLVSVLTAERIDRDGLIGLLRKDGVDARPFFYPLSSMEIYRSYGTTGPVSSKLSRQGLNLPTYADLSQRDAVEEKLAAITSDLAQVLKG